MKINANFRIFAATNFDATKYIASPSYGVNRFMLDRIGSERARATTIVEYQPNSKFPEHTHIGGEEFLVLDGTFKDQHGEFPSGTYVRNPIGSQHAPWVDNDGCTIMVKLLQMAEMPNESDPMYIDTEKMKESNKEDMIVKTDYGIVLDMYNNDKTGEKVQMCWINPNSIFPSNNNACGGEELFIVDGSLRLGDDEYKKWGWIRFPPGNNNDNNRGSLLAGSAGAKVYRKTGHLTDQAIAMEKIQISDDGEK